MFRNTNKIFTIAALLLISIVVSAQKSTDPETLVEKGNQYIIEGNYKHALSCYRKAADQGYAPAENKVGLCYRYGMGENQNIKESIKWLKKAAEKNFDLAIVNLADIYLSEEEFKNDSLALFYINLGVEQSNPTAMALMGEIYFYAGKYDDALKWFEKSADKGDIRGEYDLASMYENGYGVKIDYKKAIDLYNKSAEQGNVIAMFNLGEMYMRGTGSGTMYERAVHWFEKAASQGSAASMNSLGFLYMNGWGVPQDSTKAFNLYQQAAENGNTLAINNIGYLYLKRGYYDKALNWFQKAADKDVSVGHFNLGYMYENGLGVEKNYNKAISCYQNAASKGNKEAGLKLEFLNKILNNNHNVTGNITIVSNRDNCHALVIGNDEYSWGPLSNPSRDAKDFAEELRTFGFKVMHVNNAKNKKEMSDSIAIFCERARECDLAIVYYSGHACQFDGKDYMLPLINANDLDDISNTCVSLEWLLNTLKNADIRERVIMLDACRSSSQLNRGSKGINISKGYSHNTALVNYGTCIAYATQNNEAAYDGFNNSIHSPYMEAILSLLNQDEITMNRLFEKTIYIVSELTNGMQIPVHFSNPPINFIFKKVR